MTNMVNSFPDRPDTPGRGRPRGGSDARARLIQSARARFLSQGYAATSARSIARDAGVDHAMVNYYFGSKQGLFGEVMALSLTPATLLDEIFAAGTDRDPVRLAERLVGAVVTVWDQPQVRAPMLEMLDSALADRATRAFVGEYIGREVMGRLADHLRGPDARRRAMAIGTVLAGMIFTRHVMAVDPIASMSAREVTRMLTPLVVQHVR